MARRVQFRGKKGSIPEELLAVDQIKKRDLCPVVRDYGPEPTTAPKSGYEWVPIKMTPDSGACEHVGNPRGLAGLGKVKLTEAVKQGVTYGTASGHSIPNLGQLDLSVMTGDGINTELSLQMADVTKTLLSVKRMTSAGNRVVFDPEGSFVENKTTGCKTKIHEDDGTYSMVVWAQARKGYTTANRFQALAVAENIPELFDSDFPRPA